jgi:hypothetical protein
MPQTPHRVSQPLIMLQSLDTVIAFVVIMTIASLFVTILVQMSSAALSLRGKNLANALALTFQTIDPLLAEKAHQLAARILSDPLISDSTRTQKDKNPSSAVDRTRPWHFTDITCATHLAKAVRPEEVYAALKKLAAQKSKPTEGATASGAAVGSDPIAEAAESVLNALVTPEDKAAAIKARLGAVLKVAEEITDAPIKQKLLGAVDETSATVIIEADVARAKFDTWFSSALDRAQQWFQVHTRGLTIAASALVALLLQLDAVEVFNYASTNVAARNALVASADRVIKEADGALDEKGDLVKRIADAWAEKQKQTPIDLKGITHTGQLQEALARQNPKFDAQVFDDLVETTTKAYYKDQTAKLRDLTRAVSATGFEFIPAHYWRWPSAEGDYQKVKSILWHLPGIALFAALLSLGAPYWYNLLKNLASLRPRLAQLISEEDAGTTPSKK